MANGAQSTPPAPGPGTLIWHSLRGAALKFGFGSAATAIGKTLVPAARAAYGVQVLQPMGRVAANLAPVVRAAGRWGTSVSPIAPLMMVAMNPTNRFPGSAEEREGMRRDLETQRQQQAAQERNDEMMRNLATQRQLETARQDAESQRQAEAQRRNALLLKPPQTSSLPPMRAGMSPRQRLEPFKLRPTPNLGTPFDLHLMRPPPRAQGNPFKLSVMGGPSGTPFGLNIGIPQLRPPTL